MIAEDLSGVYRKNELALRVIALEDLAKRLLDTIAKMQEENRDMQRDIENLKIFNDLVLREEKSK